MAKKDYEKFATVLRKQFQQAPNEAAIDALVQVTKALGEVLAEDNPRFDPTRFVVAVLGGK